MQQAACAIGRFELDGPWIGFAPGFDEAYLLVIEDARPLPAGPIDLLAIAILYFEDALAEPPEGLAATHGDIGAIVRHVADLPDWSPDRRRAVADAVDAIDDGLAADVVITRLQRALGARVDPRAHLAARVAAAR